MIAYPSNDGDCNVEEVLGSVGMDFWSVGS